MSVSSDSVTTIPKGHHLQLRSQINGLLFTDENDLGWACAEILTEHSKDKPIFRFVAPVEIKIKSDEPPDLQAVQLWLMHAARLYVDYHQDGLSHGTAILTITWSGL